MRTQSGKYSEANIVHEDRNVYFFYFWLKQVLEFSS